MRKTYRKTLAAGLALCVAFSAAACNQTPIGGGEESNICEVKAVIAGYGVDWLEPAAKQFNEMYADEGYEVRITLTDTEINAQNEICTPNRNTTDLYFEYNNIDTLINKSRSILRESGVSLLEDLSDVWEAKAIGADKQEQGMPIRERLDPRAADFCSYNGVLTGFDGLYGIPYEGGTSGIFVNMKTLEEKGYTTDDLLTTDALLEMVRELAPANPLDDTQFFPVAWSGGKAPGYWDYLCQILIAQYAGAQKYENIWNFIPDEGESAMIEKGYEVYEEWGIYEALKVIEELENRDYAVPGTSSMTHTAAQARVFTGSSLFMVSGDWIYKEMEKDYGQYMEDVIAIQTPVISALGVKLGLCGKTHTEGYENYDCDDCETILRTVVKAVDANELSDAEIAAANGITADKVATIRESRGYYRANTATTIAFIPSYSNAKTVAKLFLRFIFSDDGNEIYHDNSYNYFAIEHVVEPDVEAMNEREKAVYMKMYSENSSPIYEDTSSPIRSIANVGFYPDQGTLVNAYTGLSYSHSQGTPTFTAKGIYESNITYSKASWNDWLQTARLI